MTRGIDRGNFDAGFSRPALPTYGLPEAPVDGVLYGRQDGQWVAIVVEAASATPLANASAGSVGVSTKYAREDHYHPGITIADVPNLQTTLNEKATITYVDSEIDAAILAAAGVTELDHLNDVTISSPTTNQVLKYNGSQWINGTAPTSSVALDDLSDVVVSSPANGQVLRHNGTNWVNTAQTEALVIACSDESTALTAGTAKTTFRMPYAFTLTAVRASLTTAQASGSIFTVDVNEAGTTVISTKLTIDNTEKTSTTAATAAVISDATLADDAEITVDIDQIGDGTAKGLKVYLIGYRT